MDPAQQKLLEMYPTFSDTQQSNNHQHHNHQHDNHNHHRQSLTDPPEKKNTMAVIWKKIIIAIVISSIGSFIYSKIAYHFTEGLHSSFTTSNGDPSCILIGIHTILFALLIYAILMFAN